MKSVLSNMGKGAYFLTGTVVTGIISLIWFSVWASGHGEMDGLIMAMLVAGAVIDVILLLKDNDYLVIASIGCYSISVVKLLTNSVGSFVDAYQGVKMFGDASQVGTIIKMSVVMGICVLLSIIAAFLQRRKV